MKVAGKAKKRATPAKAAARKATVKKVIKKAVAKKATVKKVIKKAVAKKATVSTNTGSETIVSYSPGGASAFLG